MENNPSLVQTEETHLESTQSAIPAPDVTLVRNNVSLVQAEEAHIESTLSAIPAPDVTLVRNNVFLVQAEETHIESTLSAIPATDVTLVSNNVSLVQTEETQVESTQSAIPAPNVTLVSTSPTQNQSKQSHEKSTLSPKNYIYKKKKKKYCSKSKNSSIISLNIRGIIPGTRRDKLIFLQALGEESESEVIFITETHLNQKISDYEISLPGWGLVRGDRLTRQSGGTMIFYRDQMTIQN